MRTEQVTTKEKFKAAHKRHTFQNRSDLQSKPAKATVASRKVTQIKQTEHHCVETFDHSVCFLSGKLQVRSVTAEGAPILRHGMLSMNLKLQLNCQLTLDLGTHGDGFRNWSRGSREREMTKHPSKCEPTEAEQITPWVRLFLLFVFFLFSP